MESETDGVRLGGYVLAGGQSSRMGSDKALLTLAGHPLIAHAVAKLRRVAGNASILAGEAPGRPALQPFAPLVCDAYPGCGPMAGIEAALRHSPHEWNLILPLDVPLLPAAILQTWVHLVLCGRGVSPAVSMFRTGDRVQPTLLLIHRTLAPQLERALAVGEFKLLPVLERAAREVRAAGAPASPTALTILTVDELLRRSSPILTEPQRGAQELWFANLNTPQEFAQVERHADALDPMT